MHLLVPSRDHGVAKRKVCMPFGVSEIDAVLPGGGLPTAGCMSSQVASGTVDGAASALFAAGVARTKWKVVWCLTKPDLFMPALAQPAFIRIG